MNHSRAKKILWGMIALYVLVLGAVAIMRHYNFQTQTWDMAAFVQTFWNSTHGRWMFNNLEEASNHLGVHMSPWLFVLVPGYFIFQSPYFLLVAQVLALGLGAWPLYLLARKVLASEKWALMLAGGYLLYPSLHWVNLFDFHSVSFFIPLFLAGFYFLYEKRLLWAAVFLALAAMTKENAILVVATLGVYLVLQRSREGWLTRERKAGLLIFALAIVYFLVSVKLIMPALGGGLLRFDRYANLGATPGEAVVNLVNQPSLILETTLTSAKLFYLFWLFVPVMFLPFLSWRFLVLLAPGILQNILTGFEYQFASVFQYDAILIPVIWIAAVFGVKALVQRWPQKQRVLVWAFGLILVVSFLLRSPVSAIHFPAALFQSSPRWDSYRELVRLVPDEVSVAAHTNLVPHVSHRQHSYMLGREPFPVDVILLDGQDDFGFPDFESFQAYVDSYLNSGEYEVFKAIDGRYLMIGRSALFAN